MVTRYSPSWRDVRAELEAEIEVATTEECCLLALFFWLGSITFPIKPRPTCLGLVMPTAAWAIL